MKILFVNPCCLDQRVTDDDALQVPIGLYYLAAGLMDRGVDAAILNLAQAVAGQQATPLKPVPVQDPVALFKETIQNYAPDIIGFSVTNPSRINAADCAAAARQILPDSLIVFGGPAPTFMAAHLFEACPALDIIVKGEGETAMNGLTRSLVDHRAVKGHVRDKYGLSHEFCQRLKQVKGLAFRGKDAIRDTGPADLIQDLDALPHPSRYFTYQHLAMSRGCPGRCTFCGSPKFWGTRHVRRHSPDWFFDEIRTLAQKGVTHFFISDDTFTMDKAAVKLLCEKITRSGISITWNAISRVDYIDESILDAMRKAGCIQISFGVESGSEKIKKILGKPIDNDTCVKTFDLVRSYGILPRAYFIYGSPGETDATIQDSVTLMERLGPLSAVFYMLVTFPGTMLYTRALNKGWADESIWHQKTEDLPWFELDPEMNFQQVKAWGDRLRETFFKNIAAFVNRIELKPDKDLSACHSDFLSRLAMTFSHGEYARDKRIEHPENIAADLFEKALAYHPDPRAFLGLAMIQQKQRQFPQAVNLMETALNHFPDNKDLNVCMGVCLMNTGNFKRP